MVVFLHISAQFVQRVVKKFYLFLQFIFFIIFL